MKAKVELYLEGLYIYIVKIPKKLSMNVNFAEMQLIRAKSATFLNTLIFFIEINSNGKSLMLAIHRYDQH